LDLDIDTGDDYAMALRIEGEAVARAREDR
jgi:hypothetical protein